MLTSRTWHVAGSDEYEAMLLGADNGHQSQCSCTGCRFVHNKRSECVNQPSLCPALSSINWQLKRCLNHHLYSHANTEWMAKGVVLLGKLVLCCICSGFCGPLHTTDRQVQLGIAQTIIRSMQTCDMQLDTVTTNFPCCQMVHQVHKHIGILCQVWFWM